MANSSRGRGRWPAPDTCGGCGVAGSAGHRTPLGWPHFNRRRWSTSHAAPTAVRLWPTLLRAFRRFEGFQQPDADELGFNDGGPSQASATGAGQEPPSRRAGEPPIGGRRTRASSGDAESVRAAPSLAPLVRSASEQLLDRAHGSRRKATVSTAPARPLLPRCANQPTRRATDLTEKLGASKSAAKDHAAQSSPTRPTLARDRCREAG